MAAINQRIPNFLGGVSQQPDSIKFPGQLRVCHNTQPDVTFGLKKRPPGEFIAKLKDIKGNVPTTDGKWYQILGDKGEKFLIQITSTNAAASSGKYPINIWNLGTGEAVPLKIGKGKLGEYADNKWETQDTPLTSSTKGGVQWLYLRGNAGKEYGLQTIQDYTLITNPSKTVRENLNHTTGTKQFGMTEDWLYDGHYAYITIDTVAYNTEYSVLIGKPNDVPPFQAQTRYRAKGLRVVKSDNGNEAWSHYGWTGGKTGDATDGGTNSDAYDEWHDGNGIDGATSARYSRDDRNAKFVGQLGFIGDNSTAYTCPEFWPADEKIVQDNVETWGKNGFNHPTATDSAISAVGDFNGVEFTLMINGQPYLRESVKTWEDGSEGGTGNADDFTGYLNKYDTRYYATVELKDGGSLDKAKTGPGWQNAPATNDSNGTGWKANDYETEFGEFNLPRISGKYPNANGAWVKLTIRDQRYTVFIESKSSYKTYVPSPNIATYKSAKDADKGNLSVVDILEGLKDKINATYNNNTTYANSTAGKARSSPATGTHPWIKGCEIIGNGLFIWSNEARNVQARGGTANSAMKVLGLNAQDISDLPGECRDGFITQVTNTENSENDDYWMKFIADDGTSGNGRWRECAKPTRERAKLENCTYTRASGSNDIVVTKANHGFTQGETVKLDFTSGIGVDGVFIVTDVDPDNDSGTDKFSVTSYDDEGEPITSAASGNCTAWKISGMSRGFLTGSMPHALVAVRDNDNLVKHFTFIRLGSDADGGKGALNLGPTDWHNNWKEREIGDTESNPMPSFVNKKIQKIFFYRNRLGVIANEQIVLSRPGSYFNFFNVSAITTSDDNPVDIAVSDDKPGFIKHVLTNQKGVMLFSPHSQFMLYSETDLLSPKTARIKKLSNYETSFRVPPVDMGVSVMFTSSDTAYTRAFEATIIDTDVPPQITEQTRVCPEFVPKTIDISAVSPKIGMVTFGQKGDNNLYHYKYFNAGEQREQSAWHSWDLLGTLETLYYNEGNLFVVTKQGTDYVLNRHEFVSNVTNQLTAYTLGTGTVGSPLATSRWFEACLDNSIVNTPFNMQYKRKGDTGSYAKTLVIKCPNHGFGDANAVTLIFTERPSGFDVTHNEFTDSNGVDNASTDEFEVKFDSADTIAQVKDEYKPDQKGYINNKHVGGYNTTGNTKITHIGFDPTQLDNTLGKPYLVAVAGADTNGDAVAGTVIQADSVAMETIDGVSVGTATWNGIDLRGWSVAIGYKYTSTIELPNYYLAFEQGQYDLDAELRISALNLNLGVSGPMEFKLTSELNDMDVYTQYESGMLLGSSNYNEPPSKLHKTVRIPIQKKNNKYKLQISVPDPFSTSIISGSWDGRYNTKRHVRK